MDESVELSEEPVELSEEPVELSEEPVELSEELESELVEDDSVDALPLFFDEP
ncbi:MAG: hypothetical protein V3V67_13115 [Myxococcota bacterium]